VSTYDYDCGACGDTTHLEFPIGTARRVLQCDCGGIARLVIGRGVRISEKGFVTKGDRVREVDNMEDRWDHDIPAYRRMRHQGWQPPQVDGAAELEDRVGDQWDIDYRKQLSAGMKKEHIREVSEEIVENWPSAG
jgi:hypothetical protein